MEHLRSLESPSISDEQKAKIINEISESFDTFLSSEGNCNILEVLNVFINFLKNGDYQFFSESSNQKVKIKNLEKFNTFLCLLDVNKNEEVQSNLFIFNSRLARQFSR